MLELLLCSLVTILPDYLYRRYAQGKRLGKEITLYSVWFELRWGITACLMLTVGLITVIFYNHPSTSNVTVFFRTVPIVSETNGRVAQVYIDGVSGEVKQGQPIFRLDSSAQEAAVEAARRKIAEVEAAVSGWLPACIEFGFEIVGALDYDLAPARFRSSRMKWWRPERPHRWLAVALKQSPPFFICLAPRRALDLDPVGLLSGAIWRIATLRDYLFKSHAIRSLQQLEAIIEAL
jgi:hypothetical protein